MHNKNEAITPNRFQINYVFKIKKGFVNNFTISFVVGYKFKFKSNEFYPIAWLSTIKDK